MEYTQKLIYQSNNWYNDGLEKARIHDLTGAVTSLKKSLQFNSENIAARNLLGLVYYGRGEVGEALVEWILSKNLQPQENIADYYIQKIQKNPEELEKVNQAIQKYNQSLVYCEQGGEDLAIIQLKKAIIDAPNFLKAYQLLALLYLHTEQYAKARNVLREANKLDTTNDITLRYIHELTELRKKKITENKREEGKHAVSYKLGNETIIQPASALLKDNNRAILTNIGIGILVGVAVMWFLVLPAVNKNTRNKTNKQVVEFSNRIAKEEAQVAALKTELESYRANSDEVESAQQTAESTQKSYEIVFTIYPHFKADDMKDAAMIEELLNVNEASLGGLGKDRYDEMTNTLFTRYGKKLYDAAKTAFDAKDYTTAVKNLTELVKFDEDYGNGDAMELLAKSYEAGGDEDAADEWKAKLKKDYKRGE